ncbi:MAG: DNA lyase [Spirochaetes bacterium]|nr:DNA lyase [Spirochaetota bacterium]
MRNGDVDDHWLTGTPTSLMELSGPWGVPELSVPWRSSPVISVLIYQYDISIMATVAWEPAGNCTMTIITTDDLLDLYNGIRPAIESRLAEFSLVWGEGSNLDLFIELVFCLLTPQSGARRCHQALQGLVAQGTILEGDFQSLRDSLRTVRFMNTKAGNILLARESLLRGDRSIRLILEECGTDQARRRWLVEHVRGLGWKEASHYLRNIGLGERLAILDRHILRQLVEFGVIPEMTGSLSPRRYREIEGSFLRFSDDLSIPPLHMDLLLWYAATGEIFK